MSTSLTHNPTLELSTQSGADETAAAVSAQWTRAQNGLAEIVRFGAMMVAIGNVIETGRHRNQHSGQTLKGWLSEHCPEVNYNTARGYRDAALGVAAAAELPDALPLLALMDGAADEMDATRARVMQIISGASIALLKDAKRRGGAREGAGRPRRDLDAEVAALNVDPALAAIECNGYVGKLYEWAITRDGWGCLTDRDLVTARATLKDILKRADEIAASRERAASGRGSRRHQA